MIRIFRSVCFDLYFYVFSTMVGILGSICLFLPSIWTCRLGNFWSKGGVEGARWIIGLKYRWINRSSLDKQPGIYAVMHQSAWETILSPSIFAVGAYPAVVMKQELFKIPFFGWLLMKSGAIGIKRKQGIQALKLLIRQSKTRLEEGRSILIFPQGSRCAPGDPIVLQAGIAAVYKATNVPVYPIVLNSGLYWPRRQFLKKPGQITLKVLPAIQPGLSKQKFMETLTRAFQEGSNTL